MQQLRAINRKARTIDELHTQPDVVALQGTQGPRAPEGPHIPLGCSFVFSPGWEVDSTGSTAGL